MNKLIKKITSAALAVSMLMTSSVTVSAAEQTSELEAIMYGDLECYEVDGQYFAEMDGEIFQVYIPGTGETVTDTDLIEELESRSAMQMSSRSNTDFVSIGAGSVYKGYADMSSGVYRSPTFLYDIPSNSYACLTMKTGFLANTVINCKVYFYLPWTGEWESEDWNITFNLIYRERMFQSGSYVESCDRCYLQMYRDGSDVTAFNYEFYQKSING